MVIFHWLLMDKLSVTSRPCHVTMTAGIVKYSCWLSSSGFPSSKRKMIALFWIKGEWVKSRVLLDGKRGSRNGIKNEGEGGGFWCMLAF